MSVEKIGDMCEVRGKLTIEWKIKKKTLFSCEKYIPCASPNFYFAGASWGLLFYPNGDREEFDDRTCTSIFLVRRSSGSPVTINYTFGLEASDESSRNILCPDISAKALFDNYFGNGCPYYISRSKLLEAMSEADELTITCSLESTDRNELSESFFHRLQLVSHNLRDIYKSGKRTDVILKVDGENLHAHRMILEMQSPVFAGMFDHDTKLNQNSEVTIEDFDKKTVHAILAYLYSGEIEKLTTENVLSLYVAAKRFDISEVKSMCLKFILRKLSVDWLCDIIKFAYTNDEKEVGRRAKEYFIENVSDLLSSDKWKAFVEESPDVVLKFLV